MIKRKPAAESDRIHHIVPLAALSIAVALMVFIYRTQTRPVRDAKSSEMKSVPREVLSRTSAPRVAGQSAIRVPILMYHYVEFVADKKDVIRQKLNVPPPVFESQVKTLKDAGYTFMTASQLADVMDGMSPLPEKPVLLTIDDGHWDLDTVVLPILKKYRAYATAYIISGFIGSSDFLSAPQLSDVAGSGLVEIGAHTIHHVSLLGKLKPIVAREVDVSKRQLEEMTGSPVVSFAYPNGSFDQQAIDTVAAAGFRTAVSTVPGITASDRNRFFLFRLRPGGRTGKTLLEYLESEKERQQLTAYHSSPATK